MTEHEPRHGGPAPGSPGFGDAVERGPTIVGQLPDGDLVLASKSLAGHGLVAMTKRYLYSWSCSPCGLNYGTEEDEAELVAPDCPLCGRKVERQSVVDRKPQDA